MTKKISKNSWEGREQRQLGDVIFILFFKNFGGEGKKIQHRRKKRGNKVSLIFFLSFLLSFFHYDFLKEICQVGISDFNEIH